MKRLIPTALALVTVLAGGVLPAQVPDGGNIPNWSTPATWSPSRASGGMTTMTDISPAIPFVAVSPCRLADTRAGQGFSGQAGPPSLPSNTTRVFQITGSTGGVPAPPAGCAPNTIPVGAEAVSVQITVVFPSSAGNLLAWDNSVPIPSISVLNWDGGTIALGNGTIVPLSSTGQMAVRLNAAAGQTTEVVIDVNGYFSDALGGNHFVLENNSEFQVMELRNFSATCTADCGLVSRVDSNANASAVLGFYTGGGPGAGVSGTSLGNIDSAGVRGSSLGAGAGVEGTSLPGYGVIGITEVQNILPGHAAVGGFLRNIGASTNAAAGYLGRRTCISVPMIGTVCNNRGVYSDGNAFVDGNLNVTGTKSFVEPTAADPNKMINYVSLEGPEAGTYFRGRGRFARGMARIAVPDHFREVTDSESLSVQITPIGGMATVGVLRIGLDEIVVQSSRNLEFFYMVNGVRRAYKDHPVIQQSEFLPQSADARMPDHYPAEIRQRLIAAGVYNADGTVNMETAERLGWTRGWAESEERRAEAAPRPAGEDGPARRH